MITVGSFTDCDRLGSIDLRIVTHSEIAFFSCLGYAESERGHRLQSLNTILESAFSEFIKSENVKMNELNAQIESFRRLSAEACQDHLLQICSNKGFSYSFANAYVNSFLSRLVLLFLI